MEAREKWPGAFAPRLFDPEETAPASEGGDVTADSSLTDFTERWYIPAVSRRRQHAEGTIAKIRDALRYWRELTGDPSLRRIDDIVVAQFEIGLRSKATWRRAPMAPARPLSPLTQAGHLSVINTLLAAAGPRVDRRRPAAGLIAAPPIYSVVKPGTDCKDPFELDVAQAIAAATAKMPGTSKMDAALARLVYAALIAALYYTGLRIGTVLALRWEMVEEKEGRAWLNVPAHAVSKTSKPCRKLLHVDALAAATRIRHELGGRNAGLYPWPHCRRHLIDRHEHLEQLAGQARTLGLHAWRRTFATQMGLLGADRGLLVAQHALDHADKQTTKDHYLQLEAQLIPRLPRLELPTLEPQRRLF